MKKPVSRWAILFFVIAGLVFLGDVDASLWIWGGGVKITPPPSGAWIVIDQVAMAWNEVAHGFLMSATFLACAVIIEKLDQIRWNTTPPDERGRR